MRAALGVALLACLAVASAQTVNLTNLETLISGYTGGWNGQPSQDYLISMATTLASGFLSGVEGVVSDVLDFAPPTYSELLQLVENDFCTPAFVNASKFYPPAISGPTFTITFSGGACLLNESTLIDDGQLEVDCISPAITLEYDPATITSAYESAIKFTDKVCSLSSVFGVRTDQVVAVLDSGIFNITGIADTLGGLLSPILGEFSSLTAASPLLAPALDLLGSAGNDLASLADTVLG